MTNFGIFGPKLSGKTTLAKSLSRQFWLKENLRSLVLDPHNEEWGGQALVFTDEKQFWQAVWKSRGCLILVEESAATIRRDRALVPVFTRLRHNQHKLGVIGHSGMDLLPVMRQQLDAIYLFRQPEQAAKVWADNFCEPGLLEATGLNQFEFIYMQSYGKPFRHKLKP